MEAIVEATVEFDREATANITLEAAAKVTYKLIHRSHALKQTLHNMQGHKEWHIMQF